MISIRDALNRAKEEHFENNRKALRNKKCSTEELEQYENVELMNLLNLLSKAIL